LKEAEESHLKQSTKHERPKMKRWTPQFVTAIWASGGFNAIAQLHNRELDQLKGEMKQQQRGGTTRQQ
jgi:hypothetical protein